MRQSVFTHELHKIERAFRSDDFIKAVFQKFYFGQVLKTLSHLYNENKKLRHRSSEFEVKLSSVLSDSNI